MKRISKGCGNREYLAATAFFALRILRKEAFYEKSFF